MPILIYFLIFFVSLFIGSFFNVLIDRIFRNEQFFKGRSYCENCKHDLHAVDLIPVFSFLFLNGKCRYCKKPIPASLAIVEITTAILFTLILFYAALLGLSALIFYYLVTSVLIVIFFTDAKYYVIPDIYFYFLFTVYVVFGLLYFLPISHLYQSLFLSQFYFNFLDHLYGMALMTAFFASLHYLSKGRLMGEGDIYLGGLLGLFLGLTPSIVMWFVSFLTGALVGVILILRGRKRMEESIPFGPFLILGAIVAHLFVNYLVTWYLAFL